MHQQHGRKDLGKATDHRPEGEDGIGYRQFVAADEMQAEHIEDRDRETIAETHEARASRAERGLQVLLKRRPQVLQEGGGDGDQYPGFHFSPVSRLKYPRQGHFRRKAEFRIFFSLQGVP